MLEQGCIDIRTSIFRISIVDIFTILFQQLYRHQLGNTSMINFPFMKNYK